jgi:hypothetical protein
MSERFVVGLRFKISFHLTPLSCALATIRVRGRSRKRKARVVFDATDDGASLTFYVHNCYPFFVARLWCSPTFGKTGFSKGGVD